MLVRVLVCLLLSTALFGYRYRTAEQYYSLYHQHLYAYPEDIVTNMGYLLAARSAPFSNALYALTPVANESEWLYYQKLFRIHINLKLVEQQLLLASKVDKYNAYFFNRGWRTEILEAVAQADKAYRLAENFWREALRWVGELEDDSVVWQDGMASWQDEVWLIKNGELDYQRVIDRQLARVTKIRQFFSTEELEN